MAEIKPFKGIRFAGSNITKLVCPPYDVISETEKKKLKKLSPHNMVNLELPDASGKRNKYINSAFLFNAWQKSGVLKKELSPSLYFYEQVFRDHGKKMVRRGFFAALKLENPFKGNIKPHEKTLTKPKQDRLSMLKAVKANLSPIFGLFQDKEKKIVRHSEKLSKTKEDSISRDFEGTVHRLWAVTDKNIVDTAKDILKKNQIFIADGHHRYETAWNYLQEEIGKGKYLKGSADENVMIFLCPMEDKGLSVWPTHRVVLAPKGLEQKIEKNFKILPGSAFKKLSNKVPQPLLIYKDGSFRTLVIKSQAILNKAMKGKCKAYKDLGVSILHSVLLSDVLPENITFVKDENDAVALAKKLKVAAFMVPATPVKAIKDIATCGQTMPQKSTYFYPKVASGQVIHSVAGRE